jgi:glycosyltransferase involved in cell wall biosynthesis
MHKEKVSIIIPCFNHALFLEETVKSVLKSTYPNIEIVIVNDGSLDESEQVAIKLKNHHPNIIYILQENKGPSTARNKGIEAAAGKFILPLDADDLISPDYIQKAVDIFENQQDVKLVYCEAEFFGERSGKWKLPDFSRKLLARENMIFCSAVFRKSDWQYAGGYSEEMTWGWEDWEFWISLLKNGGEVVKLPITGFFYRVTKGSRRKSTNKEAKRKTIELINIKHKEFLFQYLHGPLRINRSWSSFINWVLNIFCKKENG